jgi:hypothetical protein
VIVDVCRRVMPDGCSVDIRHLVPPVRAVAKGTYWAQAGSTYSRYAPDVFQPVPIQVS